MNKMDKLKKLHNSMEKYIVCEFHPKFSLSEEMENARSLEIRVDMVSTKFHIIIRIIIIIIIIIHIIHIIQKQQSNLFIYLYYSTIYYL